MNNTDSFKDTKYYELFINNGNNYSTYWVSSRCIDADSYHSSFNVHIVNMGFIDANGLCNSDTNNSTNECTFRPCITLNSNVQVTSGNGTVEQAYIIK